MSSLRVAVVGPVHPYRGGIAHFTEMTVQVLQQRGHEVHPVSFSRQYPELLFPGKTQLEPAGDAPAAVDDAPQLIDSINPVTWLRTAVRLLRLRPDAVVFQYWMPFFAPAYGLVARFLRRAGIPSVAVVHNALPHERHVADAAFSRFFLRACRGHVVMSDAVRRNVERFSHPASRIEQIDHPVYERFGEPVESGHARAALGLPEDAPVMLFFGFIREYKGLHVLLDALPAIREHLPGIRLVIAGEAYDDPDRYRNRIERHDLEESVLWHDGYVPSDKVPLYFGAADLVVQPYVSATQSGVAQIAFHFEVPMVLTDVGGLAEVVPHEEAGLVVPPSDPKALAESVVHYFEDDRKGPLTEGVRRQKKRYAPARLAEALENLFGGTAPASGGADHPQNRL